jgi:phage gpG-like protein
MIRISKVEDTLSPDLAARLAKATNRRGIHEAMGLAVISLTKRAFTDAGLRPSAWPALKNGQPARLRKSGTLAKSPRVVASTDASVLVGTDRLYAAIHQLGGQTKPHVIRPKAGKKALKIPGIGFRAKVNHPGSKVPARPYFPFYRDGRPTPAASTAILQVLEKALRP